MKFLLTEEQYVRVTNKELLIIKYLLGEKKDEKKADFVLDNIDDFYKTLESIDEPLIQQKRGTYSYEKDVETFQIALMLLGFDLPKHGVDGMFGPETAEAYKKMIESGILDTVESKKLKEAVTEFIPTGGITAGKNVNLNIDTELQKLIVDIQSKFGHPITITSAYRTPEHNRKIGGAKRSAHLTHFAVDIVFSRDKEKTLEFARIASSLGALGIGIYRPGVVHIDIDETKGRRSWGRGFSFSGVPPWAKKTLTLHNQGYFSNGSYVSPSYDDVASSDLDDDTKKNTTISGRVSVEPEVIKKLLSVLKKKEIGSEDIQKFTNKDEYKNNNPDSNKIETKNGLIFVKNNETNNFMVIFGGTPSSQYGAKFMKNKMPNNKKTNFVFSDWENTISTVEDGLSKTHPGAKINSVVGFSKGGLRAWPLVGVYNFVGLIDPSIEGDYKSYGNSIYNDVVMTYIPNRKWGEKGLNYAINKLGNNAKPVKGVTHSGMVDDFYSKYIE